MRRKIPSLQALSCFDAAARHGSYTRAAQELALTQGAVSRQVAVLESFLGLPLFRRSQHGMVLTPAGQDYARQVRTRLDALERDTLDVIGRQGEGAALTLGAVPTFVTRWLIPRLPGLAQAYPGLQLHFETRTRPFLFSDSGLDAAIFAGTAEQVAQWAGTRAQLLLVEEVVPVCRPGLLPGGRAVSPSALARLPLLHPSTRPEAWREWFEAEGVDAPAAMAGPRYEQFSMQAAAAEAGLGVALMPALLVADELARGTLAVACNRRRPGRGYYLVHPDHEERTAFTRFKRWLLAEVQPLSPRPVKSRAP
jgi:DNA-binding transcriptional LysR family regulator